MLTVFGTKGRMTALFQGELRVPVTKITVLPQTVLRTKTQDKDGYQASVVNLGKKLIKEIRGESTGALAVGDMVEVRAVSKGKGWAGVVRKWGFHGGPKTHGQSDRERAPGSIGQTTTPGRVYKGKKMGGRMGGEQVFVKNLEVVAIENEGQVVLLKGAVPGHSGSLVTITKKV